MSTHKHVDLICLVLCLAILAVVGGLLIWRYPQARTMTAGEEPAYAQGLFSTDSVHTIDIAMEDWDAFLETCENEEYTMCTVTTTGIRMKPARARPLLVLSALLARISTGTPSTAMLSTCCTPTKENIRWES